MHLDPYLFFDGRCEEAFKFYGSTPGGKIKGMLTYAGSPGAEHVPGEWRNKISHLMEAHLARRKAGLTPHCRNRKARTILAG